MARHKAIPPETFEEILAWLDPDPDVAARKYVQLRRDLARIFTWRQCSDPEALTDEVFDRVARKVHDLRQSYKGNPLLYFRAVANNLIKENLKRIKSHVALEDAEPLTQQTSETEEDASERLECLDRCLQQLSDAERELVLAYYAKEKRAKIDHRVELARRAGTSIETLRVKVFRIRSSLEECIERCLKQKTVQR